MPVDRPFDEQVVAVGRGADDFDRARAALMAWKQFDLGWVELFPRQAPVAIGTVVAVVIRHLGFWSINGCRVLYHVDGADADHRFGFAYGTLTNHAESGEELFEVFLDPATGDVKYRIRAMSWPQSTLARLGEPWCACSRHVSGGTPPPRWRVRRVPAVDDRCHYICRLSLTSR